MRRSYTQILVNGEYVMVPKEELHLYVQDRTERAHYVMNDIQPYRSMQTGEVIGSRSTHRAHLRAHGLVEVGNEKWPERKRVEMDSCVPELRSAIREFQSKRGRR